MRLLPPEPAPGDKITAEFGRELIRCIRERQLLKSADYTVSSGPNGTTIKFKSQTSKKQADSPFPYEVRWDSTLNSGSGGWKIYLPTDHLLSYDNEEVQTSDIDGITVIQDADGQDTPWYSLDDISDSDSNVYLVITIPDDSAESSDPPAETTVEFSPTEGQATSGEEVINICIADISYSSGPPVEIEVKQSVVGALYLGKDETIEPDDVSTEFIPEAAPGTTPDGDEGQLQIKGFKSGQPATTNTIAEYLMGTAQISGQIWLIVRGKSTGGDPVLGYLPLDALNLSEYAKETDLPTVNDGTLTIKQGTTTLGTFTANQATGTIVTIPEPPTQPSGTVEFVADVDWYVNGSVHQLRKRLRVLNLATGNVTDKVGTTYANGWEVATNTTPISSILPQSS